MSATTALARGLAPEDFFDFEFANKVWTDFSDPELNNYFENTCPKDYDAWEIKYFSQPTLALKELETHPKATLMKKCFDVVMTYKQWGKMYRVWRGRLSFWGGKGWNQNPTNKTNCLTISDLNIFTGSCNDLPDWRMPENAKEDKLWMKQGNARRKK